MDNGTIFRNRVGVAWASEQVSCHTHVPWNWSLVLDTDIEVVGFHGSPIAVRGTGSKLIAYCHYEVELLGPFFGSRSGRYSLIDKVYPNGFQESIVNELEPLVLT